MHRKDLLYAPLCHKDIENERSDQECLHSASRSDEPPGGPGGDGRVHRHAVCPGSGEGRCHSTVGEGQGAILGLGNNERERELSLLQILPLNFSSLWNCGNFSLFFLFLENFPFPSSIISSILIPG